MFIAVIRGWPMFFQANNVYIFHESNKILNFLCETLIQLHIWYWICFWYLFNTIEFKRKRWMWLLTLNTKCWVGVNMNSPSKPSSVKKWCFYNFHLHYDDDFWKNVLTLTKLLKGELLYFLFISCCFKAGLI